jgi:hypothetical protein
LWFSSVFPADCWEISLVMNFSIYFFQDSNHTIHTCLSHSTSHVIQFSNNQSTNHENFFSNYFTWVKQELKPYQRSKYLCRNLRKYNNKTFKLFYQVFLVVDRKTHGNQKACVIN